MMNWVMKLFVVTPFEDPIFDAACVFFQNHEMGIQSDGVNHVNW